MEELKNVHYDAFISYRHCELDSFVAERIHKKLESFRLPKSVRKKVSNGKTKIERIFRDLEELPLSDNLMDPITNALNNSDYLITICSPRYLESIWCMKEIEVFLQTHDREHILVILAEGEPSESFPKILTYDEITATDENGNTVITRRELEPLAADVRSDNKKNLLKAIDIAVIKMSAEIFGLNFDDLKRRHRAQKIRRMIIIFGSIVTAQLIFAIVVSVMLIKISNQNEQISEQNEQMAEQNRLISEQNKEIQDQYDELEDKYAASMATVSKTLMGEGKRKDAAYALRSVLPDQSVDGYNSVALKSLYSVMDPYDITGKMAPNSMFAMEGEIQSYSVSYDGKYILINDSQDICIFDVETGNLLKKIERKTVESSPDTGSYNEFDKEIGFRAEFCGNKGLIVINEDEVSYMDLLGNNTRNIDSISHYSDFIKSSDGKVTFAFSDSEIQAFDNNGEHLYSIDLEELFEDYYYEFTDSGFDDGNALMCFTGQSLYYYVIFNEENGKILSYHYSDGSYKLAGELDGNTIYYYHAGYSDSQGYTTFTISAYDYVNDRFTWAKYLESPSISDIKLAGENLYLIDSSMIFVFDKYYGSLKNYYYLESSLICGWCRDDVLYYINYDGQVHYCDPYKIVDYTDYIFINSPTSKIISAVYESDGLYCQFNEKNYVTYYSQKLNSMLTKIDYDTDGINDIVNPADDVLKNANVENYRMINESFYSDDGKYIFANYSDHTFKIFDASSLSVVCSFESESKKYVSLIYSELTGSYILNGSYDSYILDKNLKVICKTNRILNENDGKFIITDTRNNCYEVPYVSYEKLIALTDAYLDGYTPNSSVKQKYQLK